MTVSPRFPGQSDRHVSRGTVWTIGGLAPSGHPVDDGHGHLLRRGTHARVFSSSFLLSKPNPLEELEKYHGRVAFALDIDRVRRVLEFDRQQTIPRPLQLPQTPQMSIRTLWTGSGWVTNKENPGACPVLLSGWPMSKVVNTEPSECPKQDIIRSLPRAPFKYVPPKNFWKVISAKINVMERVLDAPDLRDDFYCSVLAYSPTCHTLAVGLGNMLYTWSEADGSRPTHSVSSDHAWITSVSFSSPGGGKSILAIGRADGSLALISMCDTLPRFEIQQPCGVACLS